MQNKSKKTHPVIDLPVLLGTAIDAVELGSVRLTSCLRSINRLRELISEKSLFPEGDCSTQDIFDAADEIELMLEKASSIVDEIYSPSLQALCHSKEFIDSFSGNF